VFASSIQVEFLKKTIGQLEDDLSDKSQHLAVDAGVEAGVCAVVPGV
jgi:hypothetical protein